MTLKEDDLKGEKPIKEGNLKVGKQQCKRYEPKISVKDCLNGRTMKSSHEDVLTGKH